jgi:hypothetical protein
MNPNQRAIIRDIADEKPLDEADFPELFELFKEGFIYVELTEKGYEAHTEIMKSGDGPEHLKEMFRFEPV